MLNKEIKKEKLNKLKLLVLDSDGVSVKRGTKILNSETEKYCFSKIKTYRIDDELVDMINKLKKKIKICISSGRSLVYLQEMYSKILGKNIMLQAENGNLSLVNGKIMQHFYYNESYFRKIAKIRNEIKKLELRIKGFEPKQFILTVHTDKELPAIYKIVRKCDPEKELKVMWNGEAFDIQRKEVTKASGLKKLMQRLKIKKQETIAIGDRINDLELIKLATISVSADRKKLKADYWTIGKELGGKILVRYLLDKIK